MACAWCCAAVDRHTTTTARGAADNAGRGFYDQARAYFNTAACLRGLGYLGKALEALDIACSFAPADAECLRWQAKVTREVAHAAEQQQQQQQRH